MQCARNCYDKVLEELLCVGSMKYVVWHKSATHCNRRPFQFNRVDFILVLVSAESIYSEKVLSYMRLS
ncbi:hypothetical protein BDR03DRAFT_580904 [Suillus americanus]|nr:hypothetical protein BDR03DRAFT_580904 [Suillus americanus]